MSIRTTVVGSWPIPRRWKTELTAYYRGDVSDAAAHEMLQAAARMAMAEQRSCGLDQVMGGEVFVRRWDVANNRNNRRLFRLFATSPGLGCRRT